MKAAIASLPAIGFLPEDNPEVRNRKSFLVYLALFMSGGGMLWGSIALANDLILQSIIPYGYTIGTIFNLLYLKRSKDFSTVRFIQIFMSVLLPFLFQWVLGGFFSSGLIMLWALLALVASPSFQSTKSSFIWLALFLILTVVSVLFQDYFYSIKPDILSDQSLLFIALNAGTIGSLVFGLVVYFVYRNNEAQKAVQVANDSLQDQQGQLLLQKDILHDAIIETNHIIEKALSTGNFDTRMIEDGRAGEWQHLAISINKLFDAIVGPLKVVQHITQGMKEGDLTRRFEGEVQGQVLLLKDALNQSLEQFADLLSEIRTRADIIGRSSEEMQQASEEMSHNTTEINTAMNEIAHGSADQLSKVDQASSLLNTIAQSAKDIDTQAKAITEKAANGADRSEQAIDKVKDLSTQVGKNYEFSRALIENCQILTEEAKAISSFTGLIREIAAQTNMLSLNAGIQAADAGEHGHGFAVVAEEIRQLAQRAKGSVQEIDNLITGIQDRISDTQQTVMTMNNSIGQNKSTSERILEEFAGLREGLRIVVEESGTISMATQRQNNDLHEIVKLTENIVAIAEETVASSQEVANSTTALALGMDSYTSKNRQLLDIAKDLQERTEKFLLEKDEAVAS